MTGRLQAVLVVALVCMGSVRGEGAQNRTPPTESEQQRERVERREREVACDCCMKCNAATRSVPADEKGVPARDGCRDCCRKCGSADLPTKRNIPPEIVK